MMIYNEIQNLLKTTTAILIFISFPLFVFSQNPMLPLEKNGYQKLTSYAELTTFIKELDSKSDLVKVEKIGHSVEWRDLYALMFSATEFGRDSSKIKVLVFAQQHGNEQSGKEGALLLAQTLLKPENRYLFDKIDFALVPQMNPDGSEANKRRNANGMDLNRNHLILTEPETFALHAFFDKYLFEVTVDVHEYSPYSEAWKKYGYRKNSDITIGGTTNVNVSKTIRKFSDENYLPYILKYLNDRNFSSFEYCPGGPPEIDYIRHSTFDINDGRQSFGIQNTFSFIQEGMNGKDDSIENIRRRAEGQMTGMRGMLEYVYLHKDKIKEIVTDGRKKLIAGIPGEEISIQSEHVRNGKKLNIPLLSYFSGKDSVVTVNDYRPVVKTLYNVKKPVGYLIPGDRQEVAAWAANQSLKLTLFKDTGVYKIESYLINRVDSIDFEGDIVANPEAVAMKFPITIKDNQCYFLSTAQLKGNMIVLALEPKSMLGLATYPKFAGLLNGWESFPILRVIEK
ncbi:MAG: M14 family zinc carboxypeptidase [Bacteroidetes bacterium]|nr:M14 family zinc carboxypeptidase [Bacteroidota bacterium]